jgi:CheY-like chemotaxis protein
MDVTASIGDEGRQAWLVQARRDILPRLNRRSVLIADDQADSIEALAILLEWSGHEVHLARDGKDAMQAAREYRPELIFLDIAMPELNGYEVCRRLRAMPEFADARIYAITAFTGEPHDTRRNEAGFTGQLTKPIDPIALEQLAH